MIQSSLTMPEETLPEMGTAPDKLKGPGSIALHGSVMHPANAMGATTPLPPVVRERQEARRNVSEALMAARRGQKKGADIMQGMIWSQILGPPKSSRFMGAAHPGKSSPGSGYFSGQRRF